MGYRHICFLPDRLRGVSDHAQASPELEVFPPRLAAVAADEANPAFTALTGSAARTQEQ
jgi:hypothetical protein